MKRLLLAALLGLIVFCPGAKGEALEPALRSTLDSLPLSEWQRAYEQAFPEGEDMSALLLRLARGERALDPDALLKALVNGLMGALNGSVWRLSRLIVPAVICGVLQRLKGAFARPAVGEAVNAACFLLLAGCMAQDLSRHIRLSSGAVERLADLMQALFPLLLTLLAAVGGTAGAAFFQPAVVAASGTMTYLVRSVTLPLALGAGVITVLGHLSPKARLARLAALMKSGAAWTLGIGFTVFISVTALQSLGAAAADGVSIRAAKYAVDHFVPVVGGMVADTMDTLVGASLLIKNALGLTGLLLLLKTASGPMLQTLAAGRGRLAGAPGRRALQRLRAGFFGYPDAFVRDSTVCWGHVPFAGGPDAGGGEFDGDAAVNAFLRQIIGLSLIRIVLDAALPEDDTGRFSSLGMELAMMLCMLRALAGLLAVSAGG